MSTTSVRAILLGFAALLASPAGYGQSCKPKENWVHEHAAAEHDTRTTDIKGNRATHIEVCRAAQPAPAGLKVEVSFPGSREPRPLEAGQCTGRSAKWAVVRSRGARDASGPAQVSGTYEVCKE